LRLVTDSFLTGRHNSALYGAAWRVARATGYHRLITYTQHGETGASLRATGLVPVAVLRPRPGGSTW
jgi:hypothetical protein